MKIIMTGCSSGIGKTIRAKLEEQGHHVIGVGLGGPEYECDFVGYFNVTSSVLHEVMRDHAEAECLINNAGTTHIQEFSEHDETALTRVLKVNFIAAYAATRNFFPSRIGTPSKGFWRVIHTSSMACVSASRGSVGYVCSKVALEAMSSTLAREWAGQKPFSSLCIAPTWVKDTKIGEQVLDEYARMRGWSKEQAETYTRNYSPMGRPATHDEVWPLYDFAVNHAPIWMSGEVLRMPGGSGIIG